MEGGTNGGDAVGRDWAVFDQSARILRAPPARTPALSEPSGVTVRRRLGLARVADRQSFTYVSIRLLIVRVVCELQFVLPWSVTRMPFGTTTRPTRLDRRQESDALQQ